MNENDLVKRYQQLKKQLWIIIACCVSGVVILLAAISMYYYCQVTDLEYRRNQLQQRVASLQTVSVQKTKAEEINKELSRGSEKMHQRLERHDDVLQHLLFSIAQSLPSDMILNELASTKSGFTIQGTAKSINSLHQFLATLRQVPVCVSIDVRSLERAESAEQALLSFNLELTCNKK